MKAYRTRFFGILASVLLFAGAFAVGPAYAVEAPSGASTVSIPVTVPAAGAIAGAEIEYSASPGLAYVRFEPAENLENKTETAIGDKRYVGCFSTDNRYVPENGAVHFGNLVFTYSGDAPESILFSEVRVHTVSGEGDSLRVDTVKSNPDTLVKITRKAAGGEAASSGGGASSSGSGGTSASATASKAVVNLAGGNAAKQTVIELDVADVAAPETGAGTEAAAEPEGIAIGDGKTPLVGSPAAGAAEAGAEGSASPPGWLFPLIAAAAAAAAALVFLYLRRRRQGA
ncbi:MAG: hypothetical protein LBR44_05170 [Clostridiales Family XIII bacterium]|jgi:hypothetical protein|nr:hypothetical protein [Clostridiales Family XIII bacterium]